MLINATQEEELRMAMVDGQRLYDLNIEAPASERKKANIYKGKITRIEPSLEAAFVDYGANRHGFLPLKEISSEYFVKENKGGGKPNIKDVLREGQDIVIQVDKEERGNKGAALTTFVSLAGRFIVLKPNKARSGGVSRRITGQDRDAARKSLNSIEIPDGMSVILRTAGIDRSAEELAWDLENLLTVWTAILNVVLERPSPFLIYRESDSVVRALRDYLTNEIGEILIDDEATYKDACEHVKSTMPHNLRKLKHYVDPVPLFTRYQIESQIESAFAHTVHLPSGGSIVIDHTEALVSIDINSARATKGGDIEATALNTNLEAADEIARQLRIRDLGGLIVIDFIDMGPSKHQRDVENRLRDAVRQDRARVQIGKISRFGLLEMSRQRLRPSIGESAHMTCPRCSGFGNIRSVESLALAILRIVGEEARKERTAKVIAYLPVEVSTYLLNEKRDWVQSLEDSNDTQIVLVANPLLETPHYEVRRVRDDQADLPENAGASYALTDTLAEPEAPQAILERKQIEAPAVGTLKPSKPAPAQEKPKSKSILATIAALFKGDEEDEKKTQQRQQKSGQQSRSRRGKQTKRGDSSQSTQDKKTRKKQPAKKKTDTRRKPAQKDAEPKKPQQDKPAQAKDESEQKRPSRSRRSRGGRRRRRGADRPEQKTDDTQAKSPESGQQQDAKPQKQDSQPQKQDAKPQKQDSQPQKQDAKPQDQDSQPQKQDAKPQKQDSQPQKQDAKPQQQDSQPQKQDAKPQQQDAQPQKQDAKPQKQDAQPQKQDVTPETKRPQDTASQKGPSSGDEQKPAASDKPRKPRAKKAKPSDDGSGKAPAEKPAGKTDKPAPKKSDSGDAPAKAKLLPWESQSLPVAAKPADKPAAKKPESTSGSKAEASAPKPKSETGPADAKPASGTKQDSAKPKAEPKPKPEAAAPKPEAQPKPKAEPKPAEPGSD
jgi:ribonuclease E